MRFEKRRGGVRVRKDVRNASHIKRMKKSCFGFLYSYSCAGIGCFILPLLPPLRSNFTAICPTSNRLCLFFLTSKFDWILYPCHSLHLHVPHHLIFHSLHIISLYIFHHPFFLKSFLLVYLINSGYDCLSQLIPSKHLL